MVGRTDMQLAMSPRGPCPIQPWAGHIELCTGKRGGCVQAQPKAVEPALSCAPTSALNKRRVVPWHLLFAQNVRATAFSLPPAPAAVAPSERAGAGCRCVTKRAVQGRPSTMKKGIDGLPVVCVCRSV